MQNNCYDGDISLGPAKLPGQLYCSQTAWAVLWHVFDAGKATGVLYMGHTVKHHLFQNKALYT